MRFCTAVTCMDGRVQEPVIAFMKYRFNADYVDIVSEPGPNRIVADNTDSTLIASIESRIAISVEKHQSVGIAVVGHYDCAGNPSPEARQKQQTARSVGHLREKFGHVEVIGLWIDENWDVAELSEE